MTANKEALLELRARAPGPGMQDCLKTLAETGGRPRPGRGPPRGAGAWRLAASRADRQTPEGRVFLHREGRRAALAQLECETGLRRPRRRLPRPRAARGRAGLRPPRWGGPRARSPRRRPRPRHEGEHRPQEDRQPRSQAPARSSTATSTATARSAPSSSAAAPARRPSSTTSPSRSRPSRPHSWTRPRCPTRIGGTSWPNSAPSSRRKARSAAKAKP